MKRVPPLNTIFILLSILFVLLFVSSSREPMMLGDYPGVHHDKSNAIPTDFGKDDDVPMKPTIYGRLSWGWSGFGGNIGSGSSAGSK